jgi:hypothetical protein
VKTGIMEIRSTEVALRVCVHVYKCIPVWEGHSDDCSDILHMVNIYYQCDVTENITDLPYKLG